MDSNIRFVECLCIPAILTGRCASLPLQHSQARWCRDDTAVASLDCVVWDYRAVSSTFCPQTLTGSIVPDPQLEHWLGYMDRVGHSKWTHCCAFRTGGSLLCLQHGFLNEVSKTIAQ